MVTVVAFGFSVMRCQPLRRALCNMESSSEGFSKKVSVVNRASFEFCFASK
ncbi:acetyltransferase [Vibrio cholerae]|nr:acetyltransferase [Vibrio cholerae]